MNWGCPWLKRLEWLTRLTSEKDPLFLFLTFSLKTCVQWFHLICVFNVISLKLMALIDSLCRKRIRELSISSMWMLIRTITWTTTRGWLSLWSLGDWSATITPYGMGPWWPHPMLLSWIMLSIIAILLWSSTKLLHLIQGSRFASFPLVMGLPCAAASSDHFLFI